MREHGPEHEKPLHWIGSSKRDLLRFPEQIVDNVGYALGVVDGELVEQRLKTAQQDYEERYGKETNRS